MEFYAIMTYSQGPSRRPGYERRQNHNADWITQAHDPDVSGREGLLQGHGGSHRGLPQRPGHDPAAARRLDGRDAAGGGLVGGRPASRAVVAASASRPGARRALRGPARRGAATGEARTGPQAAPADGAHPALAQDPAAVRHADDRCHPAATGRPGATAGRGAEGWNGAIATR